MKTKRDIDELIDTIKIPSDREVEAAVRRFEQRLRRMKRRRQIIWATSSAAAVILFGIIFTLLWTEEHKSVEPVKVAKTVKVENKVVVPTLILAGGNSVNLKQENVEKTIHESNIRVEENHIVYDSVVNNTREIEYNTLVIPAGYTYNVTLADGTRVTLNAGSRLKYPVEFVGDRREVELSGEAYFDVPNRESPSR